MYKYEPGCISIIVPCYNGEKYIDTFFQSLLKQEYSNVQIIVVNDGSTDNTERKILMYRDSLEKKGMKFCYHKKENGGIGSAVAAGLKEVSGEYFIWFNIDDILCPDILSEMIRFMISNEDYGLVRTDAFIIDESPNRKVLYHINDKNKDKDKPNLFMNALLEQNFSFGCSMLRTEWFDKINPERYIYESREGQNWQILLPMFYYYKSGYIDKPLYYIIEQSESTSRVSDGEKRVHQLEEYCNIIINTLEYMNIPEKSEYISMTQIRFAHKVFKIVWNRRSDYSRLKKYYRILKSANQILEEEIDQYKKRLLHMEYWLWIKHDVLGLKSLRRRRNDFCR